jgi:DNA repair protein RadC
VTIKDWPVLERPREKLLRQGSDSLSDAELLAIFLRTGCAGKSAVDMARELLIEFGSLRAILEATQTEFCLAHGLGVAKYAQLQAVLEMARRHLHEQLVKGVGFTRPELVKDYVQQQMRHRQQEVFACLLLDNQHCLLAYRELFFGTIDGASVYPREVVKIALRYNAAAVIFTHNHPSGVSEPSWQDQQITKRLIEALGLVDIRVLDHLVVGEGPVVSFAERGLI